MTIQSAERRDPGVIDRADWRALGTGVRLLVLDGDLAAARGAVEQVLDDVDRAYSRFRADSELMAANAAAGRTIRVSRCWRVRWPAPSTPLDALRGAVDPTVGRAMRVIGYDLDFDQLAGSSRSLELRVAPVPGWSAISFDRRSRELRVPGGVELDLGATGKGLAADLAADAALQAAGPGAGVLVSLGGDMTAAGRAPDGGWRVLVAEDSRAPSDGDGEVVAIQGGAIATSSTTVRRWTSADGVTVHHIVDPRTGLAAVTPWRTATVVATTCELANGASTAAIVLGDDAPGWLDAAGLPARLVGNDGRVVRIGGWPAPDPDGAPAPTAPDGEATAIPADRESSPAS